MGKTSKQAICHLQSKHTEDKHPLTQQFHFYIFTLSVHLKMWENIFKVIAKTLFKIAKY